MQLYYATLLGNSNCSRNGYSLVFFGFPFQRLGWKMGKHLEGGLTCCCGLHPFVLAIAIQKISFQTLRVVDN